MDIIVKPEDVLEKIELYLVIHAPFTLL